MVRRNSLLSIWHSRSRLSIICVSITVLLTALHVFDYEVEERKRSNLLSVNGYNETFEEDLDYAVETVQYLHDMQIGKAFIRDVVEKPREVNEYWRCRLKKPDVIVDRGWIKNDDLYLYSATYDRRPNSLYPLNHAIQVLLMSFRSIETKRTIFCCIRDLSNDKAVVVDGYIREIWQRSWDPRDLFYVPNLITCPLPSRMQDSDQLAVQLTTQAACHYGSSPALRVRKNETPNSGRKFVAVCVKGMDFKEDISKRFVEWIEAQYLLGADTVTVYTYFVSPETQKVLDYYVNIGKLTMISLDLPGYSPNQNFIRSEFIWRNRQQKRRHELIPYNDCFYRHIDTHEYVLIIDTDEVIVPIKNDNWMEMLKEAIGKTPKYDISSVSFLNAFKFPSKRIDANVPEYMYMLRNRRMSQKISDRGEYGKSFTSTKSIASVFNHFALHRLFANVSRTIYANKDIALKLHYKETCPIESKKDCANLQKVTVDDKSLDRFADKLTKRVTNVLKKLHML